MSYTLDTNILIRMTQQYPREIFPSVWEALEELIEGGDACVCDEIREETRRGGDGLYAWASEQDGFVCPVSLADVQLAAEISDRYPEWVRETTNAADPFLVAHAKVEGHIIVSDEREAGANVTPKNQKVPNVAKAYRVPCIKFFELARQLSWRF